MLHWKVINMTLKIISLTPVVFSSAVYHHSQPISSGIDQLKKILHITGTPDSSLVEKMQSEDVRCV